MNNTWLILKVQLLSLFGINKAIHSKNKKEKTKLIGLAIVIFFSAILLLGTSFMYSYTMATAFSAVGQLKLLIAIMMAVSSIATLMTTIYKVNGVLFGFKDYDMIMSLPVKTKDIVASRVWLLYIINLFFILIVMIPAGIVYGIFAKQGLVFYLVYFIATAFIPLFPIVIASILGAIINIIASKFKHMNALNTIFNFVFVLGIMFLSSSISGFSKNIAKVGSSAIDAFNKIYPLTEMFTSGVCDFRISSLFLYFGISLSVFVAFSYLVGMKLKAINTALTTTLARSNYKMKALNSSSPFMALYKKELRRYFSSPLYVLNTSFGGVFVTVASIGVLALGVEKLENILKVPGLYEIISFYTPLFLSFIMVMSCTTACSISLEGKNLWVIKSAPIDTMSIFLSKIAVNLTVLIPIAIINATLLSFTLHMGIANALLSFLMPIVYAIYISLAGLIVNLKLPQLEWTTEVTIIKQSAATVVGLLVGFAGVLVPIIIIVALKGIKVSLISFGTIIVVSVINFVMYRYLSKKGKILFQKL